MLLVGYMKHAKIFVGIFLIKKNFIRFRQSSNEDPESISGPLFNLYFDLHTPFCSGYKAVSAFFRL